MVIFWGRLKYARAGKIGSYSHQWESSNARESEETTCNCCWRGQFCHLFYSKKLIKHILSCLLVVLWRVTYLCYSATHWSDKDARQCEKWSQNQQACNVRMCHCSADCTIWIRRILWSPTGRWRPIFDVLHFLLTSMLPVLLIWGLDLLLYQFHKIQSSNNTFSYCHFRRYYQGRMDWLSLQKWQKVVLLATQLRVYLAFRFFLSKLTKLEYIVDLAEWLPYWWGHKRAATPISGVW